MKNGSRFSISKIVLKSLIIQIIFLLLHYTYDFFPGKLSAIFSGVNESMFQHMKIAFFSISMASILERVYTKDKQDLSQFIFLRIFSAVIYPWIIFIFFYIPPAIIGKISVIWIEIVSANLILFISSICILVMEDTFSGAFLPKRFMAVSALLYAISTFLFIYFTFNRPWFDVFAIPPGW